MTPWHPFCLFLAKEIYNLVTRKARWPRVVFAVCELEWIIYICLSLYIGYFRLVSASSVTSPGSWCTIVFHSCYACVLRLWGTTHEIPSMQITHKSKHNNKWMEILAGAGENSSGATTERELKFSASNKESKKNRFAQRRSHQQETKKRLSDYRHLKTTVSAFFFFFFFCCISLFNSIVINSFWMQRDKLIPQVQCERRRWREGTADASSKYRSYAVNLRSGPVLAVLIHSLSLAPAKIGLLQTLTSLCCLRLDFGHNADWLLEQCHRIWMAVGINRSWKRLFLACLIALKNEWSAVSGENDFAVFLLFYGLVVGKYALGTGQKV